MTLMSLWRLRVLTAVAVAGTALISFTSLEHLVRPWLGWQAFVFPVCLDVVAAVGLDIWARRARAWREAAVLAMAAIALSLWGNIADHGMWLAAVPPAMLAGLLLVLHRHGTATEADSSRNGTSNESACREDLPQSPPVAAPAAPDMTVETRPADLPELHSVDHPERPAPASKRERGHGWFLEQVAGGRDPDEIKAAEVDRAIGAKDLSKKYIQDWRTQCAEEATG